MIKYRNSNNRGFTMIEIISVLIIMGVLASVVVQHVMDVNTDLIARAEIIKNQLRYAQSRAMNSDKSWYITFEPDGSDGYRYSLNETGATDNPIYLPGEGEGNVILSGGMSFQYEGSDITSPIYVCFSSKWGKPYTDTAGTVYQVGSRTINLVDAGGSRPVTVTENTGFIP